MINNTFGIKCIVLFIFLIYVEKYPSMAIYSEDTKFNMYRSLLCLYFVIYSLDNIINNFDSILNPIGIQSEKINDLFEWFNAYLIIDVGKMIYLKNNRLDLYIHHIISIILVSLSFYYNQIGLFNNLS